MMDFLKKSKKNDSVFTRISQGKTIIVVTQDDDFIQKAHQHFHMINGLLETKK